MPPTIPTTESRAMTARSEFNGEWTEGARGPGLLSSMRRHPLLVAVVTIAAGAAGYGITQALPTSYQATAHVYLSNPNEVAVFRTVPSKGPALQASDAADLMRSDEVLNRAREI